MLVIWWIWVPVVRARHKIVDFYKYSAEVSEESLSELCSEKNYMSHPASYQEANALLGISTHWRETRVKVDLALPILFSGMWVILVAFEYSGA